MKTQANAEELLYHPRAWLYVWAVEGAPAMFLLRRAAHCAGYALVGQSWDTPRRLIKRYPGRKALMRAVRRGLVDDVFIIRLSQLSEKRGQLRRILLLLQRKGVRIHTTETDLRQDLRRHRLDNILAGEAHPHA